tara:strand:+ start:1331 stop:1555 length:225 start_codon:yes stop_codon:yes gene_type:complete
MKEASWVPKVFENAGLIPISIFLVDKGRTFWFAEEVGQQDSHCIRVPHGWVNMWGDGQFVEMDLDMPDITVGIR